MLYIVWLFHFPRILRFRISLFNGDLSDFFDIWCVCVCNYVSVSTYDWKLSCQNSLVLVLGNCPIILIWSHDIYICSLVYSVPDWSSKEYCLVSNYIVSAVFLFNFHLHLNLIIDRKFFSTVFFKASLMT